MKKEEKKEEKKIKFKIIALSANDKATDWVMKVKSPFGITEAKNVYSINIEIDDDYFTNKVNEQKLKIAKIEAKPDMFADFKKSIQEIEDNIKAIGEEKKELKKMEIDKFDAVVEQVDFAKDVFTFGIPEKVIVKIIELRHKVAAFVVNLK